MINDDEKTTYTPRGGKILQIKYRNAIFRDSMCHLVGSLSQIATTVSAEIKKGCFPHLFSIKQNLNYQGHIPDWKYFDVPSWFKGSDGSYQELKEWHASQTDTWNFKNEAIEYCKNDVEILSRAIRNYHRVSIDRQLPSPLLYTTAPSHVHWCSLLRMNQQFEIPNVVTEEDKEAYHQWCIDNFGKTWCRLQKEEMCFSRMSLRGGRTEAFNLFANIKPGMIIK
ncbi:MAG TPA: hypothetical protein DCX54_11640, partial [Flavobacteriales bacterium]|nr:hypothetical protein [Flavobacteriales bacterium]